MAGGAVVRHEQIRRPSLDNQPVEDYNGNLIEVGDFVQWMRGNSRYVKINTPYLVSATRRYSKLHFKGGVHIVCSDGKTRKYSSTTCYLVKSKAMTEANNFNLALESL